MVCGGRFWKGVRGVADSTVPAGAPSVRYRTELPGHRR